MYEKFIWEAKMETKLELDSVLIVLIVRNYAQLNKHQGNAIE